MVDEFYKGLQHSTIYIASKNAEWILHYSNDFWQWNAI